LGLLAEWYCSRFPCIAVAGSSLTLFDLFEPQLPR
jgi:hypothetical protein